MVNEMSFAEFRRRFPASCPGGFTQGDLKRYFEKDLESLHKQLFGQTGMICEGRRFNHEKKQYEPTDCAETPHGLISYEHDVWEWYVGRPVSDW